LSSPKSLKIILQALSKGKTPAVGESLAVGESFSLRQPGHLNFKFRIFEFAQIAKCRNTTTM